MSDDRRDVVVVQGGQSSQALPALCNFFCPGLGQLIQGRVLSAFVWHVLMWIMLILDFVTIGIALIIHVPLYIWCIVDAARYKG